MHHMAKKTTTTTWGTPSIVIACSVADGAVLNPITAQPIAKIHDGMLDVRRPGQMSRPSGVKATTATIAALFAAWYFNEPYAGGIVTPEECKERFGEYPDEHPDFSVSAKESPIALVEAQDAEGKTFVFLVVNDKIVRVGLKGEKSYLWAWSKAKLEASKGSTSMTPRSTRAQTSEELFRVIMGSFDGKFSVGAEPKTVKAEKKADKPNKAPPKKAAHAPPARKAPPKKIPTK
jgi:hypothetical protein